MNIITPTARPHNAIYYVIGEHTTLGLNYPTDVSTIFMFYTKNEKNWTPAYRKIFRKITKVVANWNIIRPSVSAQNALYYVIGEHSTLGLNFPTDVSTIFMFYKKNDKIGPLPIEKYSEKLSK